MKKILIIFCMMIVFASSLQYPHTVLSNNKYISYVDYSRDKKVQQIIDMSGTYIGRPYKWGAIGPYRFDCSGFTLFIFQKNGIGIPRTSNSQYLLYKKNKVSKSNAKAGDLIFFKGQRTKHVCHVGMVVYSNNDTIRFIHASKTGIKVSSLHEAYYKSKYVGISRVIES